MSAGVKRKGADEISSEIWKKKQIARQRWQILAETLKGHSSSETQLSHVSVRRFHTFGLFKVQKIDSIVEEDEQASWHSYTCPSFPNLHINIRHVCKTIRPEDLLGFNNTGNVCVWPSEEIMTYYCFQHVEDFRGSSIVELGGGMTCLTGVALAASACAKQVVLTDGNEQSVSNLHNIIQENNFGETHVSTRLLRWGPEPLGTDLQEAFDWVLCADCLFFDEGREHLVQTIYSLLKPGGQALVFAPGRNGTFEAFCDLAERQFVHVARKGDQYDDHVQTLHSQLKASSDIYSQDLHLPLLVELRKRRGQTVDSRDTTPESR
ncbi:calmodulin-lysine N-methyltransferase-like [Babylonia areolata]|uniref:calmodulin-lysine N-methyltransferase-like n=1 Tax=Babylonia areolata TaxID=304850 RepID=UPI003FD3C590